MTRRDRHGRVIAKSLTALSDFEDWKAENATFMLHEVDSIARRIFVDRNATGAPPRFRAEIRGRIRPLLKKAASFAGKARAALLRGDENAFALNRAYAHHYLAQAQVAFRQPFMDRYRASAEAGRRGGRPPSEHDEDWLRMFEDRQARNPALSKSEICKRIATVWSDADGRGRSARTIEDGINRAQKVRRKPPFLR